MTIYSRGLTTADLRCIAKTVFAYIVSFSTAFKTWALEKWQFCIAVLNEKSQRKRIDIANNLHVYDQLLSGRFSHPLQKVLMPVQ